MTEITFQGQSVKLSGVLPSSGTIAPDCCFVQNDLSELRLGDLKGRRVILNVFPSLDTGVCAMSVRKFNSDAASVPGATILCISKDLPFAQARFCGAEGIENVKTVSVFRDSLFENSFGLRMETGPLAGLLARAVIVLDEQGKIVYTQLVPEITVEPDYQAALDAVKNGK